MCTLCTLRTTDLWCTVSTVYSVSWIVLYSTRCYIHNKGYYCCWSWDKTWLHFLPWVTQCFRRIKNQISVLRRHVMQSRSFSWRAYRVHCISPCLSELHFLATFVWSERTVSRWPNSRNFLESRILLVVYHAVWVSVTHPCHSNQIDQ